jgi:limonene-1,2-epoxide hydrolase
MSAHPPLVSRIEEMIGYLTVEDWESFYPYFTEKLYYKVGASEPMTGAKAAAEYLSNFYQTVKPSEHVVRGAWQIDDKTVIIEMEAHYKRIADQALIVVPCCDVYRFEGELISEWRVYPDVSNIYK